MEDKQQSPQFLRHRKFLMVVPLLIIPFLTMAFWALGGGKGNTAGAINVAVSKGLNTAMPNPVLKNEKGFTKMSFYDLMAMDSLKMKEREKSDPFFQSNDQAAGIAPAPTLGSISKYNNPGSGYTDPNETKVYQKLAQLTDAMHQGETAPNYNQLLAGAEAPPASNSPDVNRLEQLTHSIQSHNEEDTEMQQLNKMMDKIIAIQHPESAKDTGKAVLRETNAVHVKDSSLQAEVLQAKMDTPVVHNGFYSLDDGPGLADFHSLIRAVVPETQTVVAGATVKLLLGDDITVKGITVPKNSFIYGVASMSNERLKISITSVRSGNAILPVALEVFDMDGLAGIYIPGSINRDVAKESADNAVNSMGLTSLDPSIGAQAATAGIEAAKTLISKKVRLVKVTLPAGYTIFLQDKKQ
jgi:conjugative transposon TraM protein